MAEKVTRKRIQLIRNGQLVNKVGPGGRRSGPLNPLEKSVLEFFRILK